MKTFAYMYHKTLAPRGKLVDDKEVPRHEAKGWVHSPAYFLEEPTKANGKILTKAIGRTLKFAFNVALRTIALIFVSVMLVDYFGPISILIPLILFILAAGLLHTD